MEKNENFTSEISLNTAPMPLLSDQSGRPILAGTDLTREDKRPFPVWLCDIIPTAKGVKSVVKYLSTVFDYTNIPEINNTFHPQKIVKVFPFVTVSGEVLPYMYMDGHHLLFDPATTSWNYLFYSIPSVIDPTTATARGRHFIFDADNGLQEYDYALNTFNAIVLNGINMSEINGITGLNNYLIVWTGDTVYWSSPVNPLEFTPVDGDSITTGAGSSQVAAVDGSIIYIFPAGEYGLIYTNLNAVSMTFSGNANNPWIFKEVEDSGGLLSPAHVSEESNSFQHFAWTTKGLQLVDQYKATQVSSEVTSFLLGGIYEDIEVDGSLTPIHTKIDLAIEYIAGRYLCISYGPATPAEQTGKRNPFEYILVFDTTLQRWGKIKHSHFKIASTFLVLLKNGIRIENMDRPIKEYGFITIQELGGDPEQLAFDASSFYLLDDEGQLILVSLDSRSLELEGSLPLISDSGTVVYQLELNKDSYSSVDEIHLKGLNDDSGVEINIVPSSPEVRHFISNEETGILEEMPVFENRWKKNTWNSGYTGRVHTLMTKGHFSLSSFVVQMRHSGYN